jgi:hypothetical protein
MNETKKTYEEYLKNHTSEVEYIDIGDITSEEFSYKTDEICINKTKIFRDLQLLHWNEASSFFFEEGAGYIDIDLDLENFENDRILTEVGWERKKTTFENVCSRLYGYIKTKIGMRHDVLTKNEFMSNCVFSREFYLQMIECLFHEKDYGRLDLKQCPRCPYGKYSIKKEKDMSYSILCRTCIDRTTGLPFQKESHTLEDINEYIEEIMDKNCLNMFLQTAYEYEYLDDKKTKQMGVKMDRIFFVDPSVKSQIKHIKFRLFMKKAIIDHAKIYEEIK